jgi:arabinan endo-1,5-alpha-L-arabinosidase
MALRSTSGKLTLLFALASVAGLACTGPDDVVATHSEATSTGGGPSGTGGLWAGFPEGGAGGASGPELLSLSGDLEAHDPALVRNGNTFFLLHTGPLLPLKVSTNLLDWESSGSAFDQVPDWIPQMLPDVTDLWAPDLVQFGGLFHLYYAASTFGTGVSCIGHATSKIGFELQPIGTNDSHFVHLLQRHGLSL